MAIKGRAKKDVKTKNLIKRLTPGDIAVIYHQDIDEVAARQLAEKKVAAVVNGPKSISGKYPNQGPGVLCSAGILIIDNIGDEAFNAIEENDLLYYSDGILYRNDTPLCNAPLLLEEEVKEKMELSALNIKETLHDFIDNTLDYAKKEKYMILDPISLPKLKTKIKGRHVLIVTRGKNYIEDLKAIKAYITEMNPVIIGVDGGGDALLDFGLKPDIIIGDMDSASDKCLKNSREIIVHAYTDGRCPGMERLEGLGLKAIKFPFPGTSEDIALLIAYEKNAELIVTVGSHTNMIDFLEKGRKGMASTFLVRMKVGYKVIDAKGVSELYKNKLRPFYLVAVIVAALLPIGVIASMSPKIQELYYLIILRLRLLLGL